MSPKFDISLIVADHFRTLRDDGASRPSRSDIIIHFAIPLFLALIIVFIAGVEEKESWPLDQVLIGGFSLFAGLLFNLQVLLFGLCDFRSERGPLVTEGKPPEEIGIEIKSISKRESLTQETFSNVSFGILVSLGVIIITLAIVVLHVTGLVLDIARVAQMFLVINFTVTLLMILKRIRAVFFAASAH